MKYKIKAIEGATYQAPLKDLSRKAWIYDKSRVRREIGGVTSTFETEDGLKIEMEIGRHTGLPVGNFRLLNPEHELLDGLSDEERLLVAFGEYKRFRFRSFSKKVEKMRRRGFRWIKATATHCGRFEKI